MNDKTPKEVGRGKRGGVAPGRRNRRTAPKAVDANDQAISRKIQEILPEGTSPEVTREITMLVARKTTTITEQHSGPVPSARECAKYEQVMPGMVDRITTMAERGRICGTAT